MINFENDVLRHFVFRHDIRFEWFMYNVLRCFLRLDMILGLSGYV